MMQAEDLESRIRNLRSRLQSLERPAPIRSDGQPEPLSARLARLQRDVKLHLKGSSGETIELLEQLNRRAQRPAGERLTQAAHKLLARFDQQCETLEALKRHPISATEVGPFHDALDRATNLLTLARYVLENNASSANGQLQLTPALEDIRDRVDQLALLLQESARSWQTVSKQIQTVQDFHGAILRSAPAHIDSLRELSAGILDDAQKSPGQLLPALSMGPEELIAIHSLNTAHVAAFLAATEPQWSMYQEEIVVAALAQDAGMLQWCRYLLEQSGSLEPEDQCNLEKHPLVAAAYLQQLPGYGEMFAAGVEGHHERLDGSGYPRGSSAANVSPVSRLLAVADAYVAMRSSRAFRDAASARDAMTATLRAGEAGSLDIAWASRLLDLSFYPAGSVVSLSTGEIAEVVAAQRTQEEPQLAALPIVRLVRDTKGLPIARSSYRNLALCPECRIVRQLSPLEVSETLGLEHSLSTSTG